MTLEVWTDFQCPICGQFARTVEPALVSTYVTPGTLRIVHHDAAFQGAKSSSAYDESVEAAAGARCAADQGAYWPFQDWVFANQNGENKGAFAAPRLTAIATRGRPRRHGLEGVRRDGQEQTAARAETAQALAAGVERDADDATQRPDDRRASGASRSSSALIDAAAARQAAGERAREPARAAGSAAMTALAARRSGDRRVPAGRPRSSVRRRPADRSRAARPSPRASTRRSLGHPGRPLRGRLLDRPGRSPASPGGAARDRRALYVAYGLGLAGIIAVVYLTYLELVVIEAICVWCVTYALTIVAGWILAAVVAMRGRAHV